MSGFLYSFNEGNSKMKELLGVKGANLSEMTRIGLPVPFGFVVTTEACKIFFEEGSKLNEEITDALDQKIEELEEVTDKKFGSGVSPLLVSVRTSSVVAMPTMADTILNLGLNDVTVEGLISLYGNKEFALDSYAGFIKSYGTVVRGIPSNFFVTANQTIKKRAESWGDDYSEEKFLFETIREYKKIIFINTGRPFPEDPKEQLMEAISAHLECWNSYDTDTYRELHEIPKEVGMAVVVQAMAFGNIDEKSCSGTIFTRNPNTGNNEICGEISTRVHEDKAKFGEMKTFNIDQMGELFPELNKRLLKIAAILESHNKDMQEIEFTIEQGTLYMLETKAGKRTPAAAVKIAVEMVQEDIIDRETAVANIGADDINKMVLAEFDEGIQSEEEEQSNFHMILDWADEFRVMGVRANINTPEDAKLALRLGAEGIGLCRSEHMFFEEGRIYDFIKMIIADEDQERREALKTLKPYQKEDYKKIFEIMEDRPVTIRLLDPSFHNFLPYAEKEIKELSKILGVSEKKLSAKIMLLKEENPTMGRRGSRLAVIHPEIVRMQTEAIVEAACQVKKENNFGLDVSIMIPFVSTAREFGNVRDTVVNAADKCLEALGEELDYSVGTMIETPRAALLADKIAEKADFFSFGTNDLTELVYGFSKEDTEGLIEEYLKKDILDKNPFYSLDKTGVGKLIEMATVQGRKVKPKLKIGLCGDHGGDTESIEFCESKGLNYFSCSTLRIPGARLAAAQAALRALR